MLVDDARRSHKLFSNIIKKIKIIKHIEVIIAIIIVAVVLLAVGGNSSSTTGSDTTVSIDYMHEIETKLELVLSEIRGVSEVSVMITYDGTVESVLANSITTSKDSTKDYGTSTDREALRENQTESPVIVTNNGRDEALVVKQILPKIKGVIVVAKGAESMAVKMDLMRAVQTVLDITADKVEIFEKN